MDPRTDPETLEKDDFPGVSPREDQTIVPQLVGLVKLRAFLAAVGVCAYAVAMRTTCSKTGCPLAAVAVCGFSYADRQVWIDVRPDEPDPSTYGLCDAHARRLNPPRGWSLVDLRAEAREPIRRPLAPPAPQPAAASDLLSLASIVEHGS